MACNAFSASHVHAKVRSIMPALLVLVKVHAVHAVLVLLSAATDHIVIVFATDPDLAGRMLKAERLAGQMGHRVAIVDYMSLVGQVAIDSVGKLNSDVEQR